MLETSVQLPLDGLTAAQQDMLRSVYQAFPGDTEPATLSLQLQRVPGVWSCGNEETSEQGEDDLAGLLRSVDRALILSLQRQRPDLLFLHAAVLSHDDCNVLIAGRPGSGKTSLSWALMRAGWTLGSDELAPMEADGASSLCYPRALWFKSALPAPDGLPPDAKPISPTLWHLALQPAQTHAEARLRIDHLILLDQRLTAGYWQPLSRAQTVAELMPHVLNGGAHTRFGLDRICQLSRRPAWHMGRDSLGAMTNRIAALSAERKPRAA